MSLYLEIETPSGPFRFDVQGGFSPRLEPVWKEAAEPPEIVEVREVWEVQGARLLASDGEPAVFWQEWTAFLARFRVRGRGYPIAVRLVREENGSAQVVWRLGPPTHERFKIEQVGVGPDELFPRATWRTLAPVTLVVSAAQRFADPNGIVGWEQETSSRYDAGGLHFLEWRTTITTLEGTSALEKARRFGRIEVTPFGPSYTYDTNGPDGVEILSTDADEPNARVPTRAVVVSRIRQWGVRVGVSGPGTGPTEVGYSVRSRIEKGELSTTYHATARGPGALAWVERHEPAGPVEVSDVFHDESIRYAEGTWTRKEEAALATSRWQLQVELTGGHVDVDFEPVVGGYEPILFEGAILPWKLSVQVRVQRRGDTVPDQEWGFPGILPEPWILDRNLSTEKAPFVAEEAKDHAARLWAREASLIYWSPRRPTVPPLRQLEEAQPVDSYFLGQGAAP